MHASSSTRNRVGRSVETVTTYLYFSPEERIVTQDAVVSIVNVGHVIVVIPFVVSDQQRAIEQVLHLLQRILLVHAELILVSSVGGVNIRNGAVVYHASFIHDLLCGL